MRRDSFGRRLMTRLLERSGPDGGELAGDVLEELEAGRSREWAWRQALRAVAEGRWRDLRAHPRGVLAGLLLTGAMLVLVGFCLVVAASLLDRVLPVETSLATRLVVAGACSAALVWGIRRMRRAPRSTITRLA